MAKTSTNDKAEADTAALVQHKGFLQRCRSCDDALIALGMIAGLADAISYSFIIAFAPACLQTRFGVGEHDLHQKVALLY